MLTDTELLVSEEDSQLEQENTKECNFDKITDSVSESRNRFHFEYSAILNPESSPNSPYAACKETLKSKMKNILDTGKSLGIDSDELDGVKLSIDKGYISYLIDDYFLIYGFTQGKIWRIDIEKQNADLMWEIEGSGLVEIGE